MIGEGVIIKIVSVFFRENGLDSLGDDVCNDLGIQVDLFIESEGSIV